MEKSISFITKCLIVTGVVLVMLLVFLRVLFPPAKIKNMIENYAETEMNREINFDESSFRIIGVDLHNFALSERGGFKNGTFIKTKRLSFKARLLPLLGKKIYIYHVEADELFVDIIKKDGKYNLFGDEEKKQELPEENVIGEKGKINFTVSDILIKNSQIQYFDKDANTAYMFSDMFANVKNLQLKNPFETKLRLKFLLRKEEKEIAIPLNGVLLVDLQNMNLLKAYLDVKFMNFKYNDAEIKLHAKAVNFINPEITFFAETDVLTQNTLKDIIVPGLPFKFGKLKIDSEFKFKDKSIVFEKLNLSSGKSLVKSNGTINYGENNKTFNFKQVLSLDIGEILSGFGKSQDDTVMSGMLSAKAELNEKAMSASALTNDFSLAFKKGGILLSSVNAQSVLNINFSSGIIDFSSLDFFVCNSTINSSGSYDLKKSHYIFSGRSSLNIQSVAALFDKYVQDYSPEGYADIVYTFTDAGIRGEGVITDAKIKYLPALDFNALNGKLTFESIDNIKVSSMTGVLNGEKFTLSAGYIKDLRNIALFVNADIDRLYIPDLPDGNKTKDGLSPDAQSENKKNDIPYIFNLKSDFHAGHVDFLNVHLKELNVKSDLSGVTREHDAIKGSLAFNTEEVVIENLEKLINKNAYTKSAFYSLGMTYKATEEMGINVFEEDESAAKDKTVIGLKFRTVEGKAEFMPGFVHVQKLKLSSSHSSINAAGEIEFLTQTLHMRLTVKPLFGKDFVIKLEGTLDDPKTSVDLVGSAFTILDTFQQAGTELYNAVKPKKKED